MQSLDRVAVNEFDHASESSASGTPAVAVETLSGCAAGSATRCSALSDLRRDQVGVIEHIQLPNTPHGHGRTLVLRLLELGFVPGERVRIMATGPGGREPIAVRVAGSTFALRLHEAEHIRVRLLGDEH